MTASQQALDDVSEGELNALKTVSRAAAALREVADFDASLAPVIEALDGAELQLQDAAHSLSSYLNRADLDPQRLSELDERMSAWMSLARRFRRSPEDLATLWGEWKAALAALDAAADLAGLQKRVDDALARWRTEARRVSARRAAAAPLMAGRITEAMQQLGMAGGRFESRSSPRIAAVHGAETVEFLVAGHAGSTPRSLAKVASGGELSRIALAISVTSAQSSLAAAEAPGAAAPLVLRRHADLRRDRCRRRRHRGRFGRPSESGCAVSVQVHGGGASSPGRGLRRPSFRRRQAQRRRQHHQPGHAAPPARRASPRRRACWAASAARARAWRTPRS